MGELKPGWRRVKFGEVVRLGKERCAPALDGIERYIGLEHIEPGDLRVRSWGDVSDGTTFTTRVRPGHVLFGKRRAYQRKVAVADFDAVCSGDIYVFESANPAKLMPELLPFLCQTDAFFDYAVGTSAGSLSPRTNWTSLAEYEFALPPLAEQRRIAAVLGAMHAASTAYSEAARSQEVVRRSLLATVFTPKKSWVRQPLGERYEIQLGKKLSHETSVDYTPLPYLRNANVQWNRLELDDVADMPFNAKEREFYRLRYGDILACEGRHVGKAAMWRDELPEAYYQMSLHRLRPRDSTADDPAFMLYYLDYCSMIGLLAPATSETTIPHMSAKRFSAICLYFPASLSEQRELASGIADLDRAGAELVTRRDRARAMPAGLLGTEMEEGS